MLFQWAHYKCSPTHCSEVWLCVSGGAYHGTSGAYRGKGGAYHGTTMVSTSHLSLSLGGSSTSSRWQHPPTVSAKVIPGLLLCPPPKKNYAPPPKTFYAPPPQKLLCSLPKNFYTPQPKNFYILLHPERFL